MSPEHATASFRLSGKNSRRIVYLGTTPCYAVAINVAAAADPSCVAAMVPFDAKIVAAFNAEPGRITLVMKTARGSRIHPGGFVHYRKAEPIHPEPLECSTPMQSH